MACFSPCTDDNGPTATLVTLLPLTSLKRLGSLVHPQVMANELRMCCPFEIAGVCEYNGEEWTGIMGSYANSVTKLISTAANLTVVIRSKDEGGGDLIANSGGQFSGCIGRLQKNLSDMYCREVTYPLPAADTHQGLVFLDSTLAFMSVYTKVTPERPQVISCFLSFDRYVWSLCFIPLIACYLIYYFQRRLMINFSPQNRRTRLTRSRGYTFYQVITHMTATGSISSSHLLSRKPLFICLSLFSLLVVFFFTSLMKTEIVVPHQPDTFSSYQDLLDRGVGVAFLLTTDIYLYFKLAPPGTIERKLWDTSVAMSKESIVLKVDPSFMSAKTVEKILSRKFVLVGEATYMPAAFHELCSALCDQGKLDILPGFQSIEPRSTFPYLVQDARSPVIMKGLILNKNDSPVVRRLMKFYRNALEAGIVVKDLAILFESNGLDKLLGFCSKVNQLDEEVQKCKKNIIILPQAQLENLKLADFAGLLHLCVTFHLFSYAILLVEVLLHRWNCFPRKAVRSTRKQRKHTTFNQTRPASV